MAIPLSPRSFRYYQRARGVRPWAHPFFTFLECQSRRGRISHQWLTRGVPGWLLLSPIQAVTWPECSWGTRRNCAANDEPTFLPPCEREAQLRIKFIAFAH